MAVEVFAYPEEHTRLFADIISAGIQVLTGGTVHSGAGADPRLTPEIVEAISEELDRMYAYADTFTEGY